jgi:predicted nucleic acid-binding protein
LSDFEDLRLTRWAAGDPLRRRMFALRGNLSAYDAAYVALAEALACPLVTRDARIRRAPGHDARVEVL